MSFVVVTLIVTILLVGSPSAQAQATVVDQATFQQQLASSTWALTEGMDGSLVFGENGNTSLATSAAFIPSYLPTTLWNMSILFNGDIATVTAQTSFWSPAFNWSISSPMGSAPVSSLMFGITYQAPDDESITISDIVINGHTVGNVLDVDQNNPFGELSLDSSVPITSLSYDMTVYFANPALYNSEDGPGPTMLSTVAAETTSVPEPGTCGEVLLGLGAIMSMKLKKS